MAVVLDATVGGANANSYCTLAEARAFYDTQPYMLVDATAAPKIEDDAQLSAYLVWATRLIAEHFIFEGVISSATQALQLPRYGIQKLTGYYFDQGVIPAEVKNAEAAWAYYLMLADRTADNDLMTQGITSVKAGSVAVTFENPSTKVMPDAVLAMIRHLGMQKADNGVASVIRC